MPDVLDKINARRIMKTMTAAQIAGKTGCSVRTIQAACKRMGLPKKISADGSLLEYNLTKPEVKRLMSQLHFKVGRPRKED